MTQRERIMEHLEKYGSITQRDAYEQYGIMRLAPRIAELKAAGMKITTSMEKSMNRYGEEITYGRYTYDHRTAD